MSILALSILVVLLLLGAGVVVLIKSRHRKVALPAGRGAGLTGSGPPITEAVACVGCDYNLYGLASDGRCPECSCPIHISIPAAAPQAVIANEAAALEAAVPCVGCGDDLRGLRRHQLCPTCGAPAWFTLPTLLRHCDPAWLRRVRSGMTLWLWNLLIVFLLALGGIIAAAIWAVTVSTDLTGATMIGSTVVSIVAALLNVLIVWRISTPHPAHKNRDTDARLRQVTRAGTIMALVSSLGFMLVLLSELPKFYMYVTTIIGMGGLVSAVGLFLYLRDFACRIPNRKLIRALTVIMWWLCSASFIMQLSGIGTIWLTDRDSTQTPVASSSDTGSTQTPVALPPGMPTTQTPVASAPNALSTQTPSASSSIAVSTRTPGTQPPLAYSCVTGLVALASVGFTIWLVVVLFRLRAAFRSALDDAERAVAVEQP